MLPWLPSPVRSPLCLAVFVFSSKTTALVVSQNTLSQGRERVTQYEPTTGLAARQRLPRPVPR